MQEIDFIQQVKDTSIRVLKRKEVFEDIVEEINGGKMIRPRTIYILASSMGVSDFERLVPLAASTELVHLASLFHDDVIDNGVIRRDRPTLNFRYGNLISILAGDYFYSVASHLVLENYDPDVAKVYSQAVSYMTLMELRQASLRWNINIGEDEYFDIIRGKTGALFSAAFESVGIIFNRDHSDRIHLREAGRLFGEVFQLTDDLLDFIGRETGKSRLKDLSEGDITLPAIFLMKDNSRFYDLVSLYFNSKGENSELMKEIKDIIGNGEQLVDIITEYISKSKGEIQNHLRLIKDFSYSLFAPLLEFVSMRKK